MPTRKPPQTRRKPDADRRDVSIKVQVTEAEETVLREAARHAGLTVSSWLRSIGLREARKREGA